MSPSMLCTVLLLIGLAVTRFETAQTARILGFFPSPSKSHLIVHAAIASQLADAGHNVTVIASTKNVYPKAKYEYIQIDDTKFDVSVMAGMVNGSMSFFNKYSSLFRTLASTANASITHPRVQRFLHEHGPGDFDLVILGYFMNEFHFGLAAHFQCPLILSFMIQPIVAINDLVGNPSEMAYVPTLMSNEKQPMNFWARVINFASLALERYGMLNLALSYQWELYE